MLPFLKTGLILAVNQSDGNSPVFSDCLKITSNIGAILAEQLLSIYDEIPLGPWALLGSRLDSRFWIPLTLNEMEGMAWIQVFASRIGTFDKSSLVKTD